MQFCGVNGAVSLFPVNYVEENEKRELYSHPDEFCNIYKATL